jgi:hypothetical protein
MEQPAVQKLVQSDGGRSGAEAYGTILNTHFGF